MTIKKTSLLRRKQTITSIAIALAGLGLAYAPLPGLEQTVAIVSGTELQAPLQELATKFQQNNPNIKIELKFQGSQDIVYESLALSRWQQSSKNQGKPYQIYYLDPTIETVATAAVLRQDVDAATASAAKSFISYITEPEQQKVFVQHGFRPVTNGINLQGVANSPWNQNIPGVELNPSVKGVPVPKAQVQAEIQRIWQRAN